MNEQDLKNAMPVREETDEERALCGDLSTPGAREAFHRIKQEERGESARNIHLARMRQWALIIAPEILRSFAGEGAPEEVARATWAYSEALEAEQERRRTDRMGNKPS